MEKEKTKKYYELRYNKSLSDNDLDYMDTEGMDGFQKPTTSFISDTAPTISATSGSTTKDVSSDGKYYKMSDASVDENWDGKTYNKSKTGWGKAYQNKNYTKYQEKL